MSDYANDWVGQTLSGGRYRVDLKLGEGGMGFVYKVWDRNLDTDVVIKAPRKSMLDDPEFAIRFALEIRSLVKLTHPNIVKVTDVGEHEGVPFAVLQYLSGGTLDERREFDRDGRPRPVTPSTLSGWLPGIAAVLDFIHGRGYIHRDVKPANILFDTHDHPYLSDFGVAKVLSDVEATAKKGQSGLTGAGIILGTPDYMAPELIMGHPFDGRVDQYALASTAYEVLCGRKPFVGGNVTAVLVLHTTQDPPPMDELTGPGGQAISWVVLKGLSRNPGDRYGTCVEFANALVAALAKAGTAQPKGTRLACPTCGAGFAATADLTNYKGRKSKCRACGAPFRIADDGQSLQRIDPDALPTPSGSVEVPIAARPPAHAPRANRTVKLDAMPDQARLESTMKLDAMPAPTRVERTMKMEAMPAPAGRAQATMKLGAMPSAAVGSGESVETLDDEPEGRSALPWVIGSVAAVAVAALVLIVLIARTPKEPAIEIASGAPPSPIPIKSSSPPPKIAGFAPSAPRPEPKAVTEAKPAEPASSAPAMPDSPPPPVEEEKPAPQPPQPPEPAPPVEEEKPAETPARPLAKLAQAKEHLTLQGIVADPKDHLNEIVSPSDLVLVNTNIVHSGRDLPVRSKDGTPQELAKPGSSFRIVLEADLLEQLRAKVNANVIAVGEYPAILRMKVERDPRHADGFLGVVEWIEFLHYIDPIPIAHPLKNYKEAYCVVHLSPEGAKVGRSPNYKQWQARIQAKTTTVRNLYENAGRPASYNELSRQAANPAGRADFFHRWIMGHFR